MTNLFDQPADQQPNMSEDPNRDFYSELVGEDKKFKTPQDLAKGKAMSDEFILQLQTENADLRKDLKARTTLEELSNQFERLRTDSLNGNNNQNYQEASEENLTPEKINNLLDDKLNKFEQSRQRQQNAVYVKEGLQKSMGSNYQSKLKEDIRQMGMSEEYANTLAEEQPNVFLRLFKTQKPDDRSNFQSPPKSAVAAGFSPSNTERTEKYYNAIRDSNPELFKSIKIQNEMLDDAVRLGERFFDA